LLVEALGPALITKGVTLGVLTYAENCDCCPPAFVMGPLDPVYICPDAVTPAIEDPDEFCHC